jgi:uncharacterized heparinase superfamily protein
LNIYRVALLYWDTLRHLKPIQFYRRLWFRFYRPKPEKFNSLSLRQSARNWHSPIARQVSMISSNSFCFLNYEHTLPEFGGWNDSNLDKLWLYNLHYFDDLNACEASNRKTWHQHLISRWIEENPPCEGNGWEPYPCSLRIVNWIKWVLAGNMPVPGMLDSLSMQSDWLSKRIEWHLLGNHLFVNAKALFIAGLFFDGPRATGWYARGMSIIDEQLTEQVLSDGGNFERSTMYHSIFLEDLLDLINVALNWPSFVSDLRVSSWRDKAVKMLDWLATMTHPDGKISLFNDSAFSVAPVFSELENYAYRLGIEPFILSVEHDVHLIPLEQSGYIRLQMPGVVALLDVAPIGPDYLPGHAHADTLTFELSVFGQRVLVNGGTSQYGSSKLRVLERGTSSHNTVEINGESSSEVWSSFRVARRAYPFSMCVSDIEDYIYISCSHDGYLRLPGQPVHRRTWQLYSDSLLVEDQIIGKYQSAIARFHICPDIDICILKESEYLLTLPASSQCILIRILKGRGEIEDSYYSHEFGKRTPNFCLSVDFGSEENILVEFSWRMHE